MFKYMDQDNENYIKIQKIQIDKMLNDFNYRPAFTLLVLTLSKLNDSDKNSFIQYYNDFMFNKYTDFGLTLNPVARY